MQGVHAILYIRSEWKEIEMKVTCGSDSGKSGHLLISVPVNRVVVSRPRWRFSKRNASSEGQSCQSNIGMANVVFRRPNLTKHPAHFTVAGCFALSTHT